MEKQTQRFSGELKMNILLVEDKQEKVIELKALLSELNITNFSLKHAKDAAECLDFLETTKYDILILDICIPNNYSSDQPSIQSGKDLLYQINTDPELFKPGLIVGLTAEITRLDEIKQLFEKEIWKLFEYNSSSTQWKIELTSLFKYLSMGRDKYYCDIFITCALKAEAAQVERLLTNVEQVKILGLPFYFHKGEYKDSNNKILHVLIGYQAKMGCIETSLFLASCLNHIKPKSIGMCGILAGIKSELNYGDIVIAEQSWDYNAGKMIEVKNGDLQFIPDPDPVSIPNGNYNELQAYIESPETKKLLDNIYKSWPARKPSNPLNIKFGFVASGSAVINSQSVLDWIKTQKRKFIALEMEIYAFYKTIHFIKSDLPCVAIKSVADFGDGTKGDEFHEYASHTSAQVILNYLSSRIGKKHIR